MKIPFVLRFNDPSQPTRVMLSMDSLPNHILLGRLVLFVVNQYCAHSYTRNRWLLFLNQRKGENDHRKYFMINLHERMLASQLPQRPACRTRIQQCPIWLFSACSGLSSGLFYTTRNTALFFNQNVPISLSMKTNPWVFFRSTSARCF